MQFSPTDEQRHALSLFKRGRTLKINAYAGTGKTSTLELLAESTSDRGLYLAFNKAIVLDAERRFPSHVRCSTTHSLAYRVMRSRYTSNSKLTGSVNANEVAKVLELQRTKFDDTVVLEPRSVGALALQTVKRFTQSASPAISRVHVPTFGALRVASPETVEKVKEVAIMHAHRLWKRMLDITDLLPLGHDGYLKAWALDGPNLNYEFIFLDEAQDSNPVVLDLLQHQKAQIVYVGDRYQQIYEWRGAVNAMESIAAVGEARLTRSFRFGSRIASAASAILSLLGETTPLSGNPKATSRIADVPEGKVVLARTNAGTISEVVRVLDSGRRPHLAADVGTLRSMLRGVIDLKAGRQSVVPEFFGFNNWDEVIEYVGSGEGPELEAFVNLVQKKGEGELLRAIDQTVPEESADVIITTAHKSKGREWESVRLLDDYPLHSRTKEVSNASVSRPHVPLDSGELRLFYVAITRAKLHLSLPTAYHYLI